MFVFRCFLFGYSIWIQFAIVRHVSNDLFDWILTQHILHQSQDSYQNRIQSDVRHGKATVFGIHKTLSRGFSEFEPLKCPIAHH